MVLSPPYTFPPGLSYPGESSHPIFIIPWEQLWSQSHFTLETTLIHASLFTVLWIRHWPHHTIEWLFSTSSSSTSVMLLRRALPWIISFCSLLSGPPISPGLHQVSQPKVGMWVLEYIVKIVETESRMVAAGGWGEAGMGNYCLNAYRVSVLQDEKSYGDGWWRWLHIKNVFNTSKLYTLKTIKMVNFMLCVILPQFFLIWEKIYGYLRPRREI